MDEIIICTDDVNTHQILQKHRALYPAESIATTICYTDQQLVTELLGAGKRHEPKPTEFFAIKTAEGAKLCPLSDIMYCKSDGHRFSLYLIDDTVLISNHTRCRFSQSVSTLLIGGRFVKCSRSIVVNTAYIKLIDKTHVLLYNGVELAISAPWQKVLRELAPNCLTESKN